MRNTIFFTLYKAYHTLATSEHLGSEETMRMILRTWLVGVRLSEIQLQTGVENFQTLHAKPAKPVFKV